MSQTTISIALATSKVSMFIVNHKQQLTKFNKSAHIYASVTRSTLMVDLWLDAHGNPGQDPGTSENNYREREGWAEYTFSGTYSNKGVWKINILRGMTHSKKSCTDDEALNMVKAIFDKVNVPA